MNNKQSVPYWCSIRLMITLIGFIGMIIHSLEKVNVSLALICMVNQSVSNDTDLVNQMNGEYIWSKKIQGIILGSYFWGYILTQIPSGFLSSRYGSRYLFGLSILFSSVLTIFLPLSAKVHWILFSIVRFLIGFSHGSAWPCLTNIMAHWAPKYERGKLMGFMNAGAQVGNAIAFSTGGLMCSTDFLGGWPLIFYSTGLIGLIWSIIWILFYRNSPEDHRLISEIEKEFIISNTEHRSNNKDQRKFITPWRLIFSSSSCWALFIVHFCFNWGIYTFQTSIPKYLNEVFQFNIRSNGYFSTVPYISLWLIINLSGILSDMIINKNLLRKTNTRKLLNTLGTFVPALSVIGLAFVTYRIKYVGIILLTIGVGFNGWCYGGGFLLVANDIALNYAGILFGISNTLATIPGIVSPYIVAILTEKDPTNWRIVFYICGGIYLFGMIVFIAFGSTQLQSWVRRLSHGHISLQNIPTKENPGIEVQINIP